MTSSEAGTVAADNVVLVPVGDLDKRAYRALRRALEVADGSVRAVHVCDTRENANVFAMQWGLSGMNTSVPLEIVESAGACAPSIRATVEGELRGHTGTVTIVIGRLLLRRRWHRLLHDQSAEQIIEAVAGLERVRVELVDIPA